MNFDPFDEAWELVKADTGMWDEIYADLYEKLGGPLGWFNSQGIYLYREKRLLTHGGWFGLRNGGSNPWQLETKYERCRVTINYDSKLDEYFKPNIQKNKSEILKIVQS